jgi:hypothetical protein
LSGVESGGESDDEEGRRVVRRWRRCIAGGSVRGLEEDLLDADTKQLFRTEGVNTLE